MVRVVCVCVSFSLSLCVCPPKCAVQWCIAMSDVRSLQVEQAPQQQHKVANREEQTAEAACVRGSCDFCTTLEKWQGSNNWKKFQINTQTHICATHCSTLQHTAPHSYTLQHAATRYIRVNTQPHVEDTATWCNSTLCNTLQYAATRCNAHGNTLSHTATHCNTL